MEWYWVLFIIFGSLAILMASGIPVAFAFMTVNIVGVFILWEGATGLSLLANATWGFVASFVFLPIPMFILLGELLFQSGMAMNALDVIDKWLGRLRGRLALIAVAASALLSTMTGSSISTCAMLGETLVPEMEKRGYKRQIAIGSVMGAGGIAMLIPPSGLAVLWAAIAEAPVGQVLIGGAIPGFILAIFYATYIIGRCYLQPSMAPAYDVTPTPMRRKLGDTGKYVLPLGFIIFMVTGLIFFGWTTPEESAALGVLAGLILAIAYRRLNRKLLPESLMATLRLTTMVFIIISGSAGFGMILAYTGATREMVSAMAGLTLPPVTFVIVMMVVLLFLGMFMSAMPMMMITLPIFVPIINAYDFVIINGIDFSLVWFGILFLLNIEMGMSTPPFGYLLFVMKGVAPPGTSMWDVVKAGIPFLICDALVMALIIAFPILAVWLPSIMIR